MKSEVKGTATSKRLGNNALDKAIFTTGLRLSPKRRFLRINFNDTTDNTQLDYHNNESVQYYTC